MAENICAYGNSVFIPIVKHANTFEILVFKYEHRQVTDEQPSFVKHSSLLLRNNFEELSLNRVVRISKVGFFQTGHEKVIVLLRHDQDIYIVACPCDSNNEFLQIMAKFVMSDSVQDSCRDLMAITFGPVVVYVQSPNVLFLFPSLQDSICSNLNSVLEKNVYVNKILFFTSAQTVQDSSSVDIYLLAVALYDMECENQCVCVFSISYNVDNCFLIDEMHEIPLHNFFSKCYESIISSLNICLLPSFFSIDKSVQPNTIKLCWQENTTILCTQAKQCLIFHRGYMKHFCSVPLYDISRIEIVSPWMPLAKWHVFLGSSSKGVSWLNLKTGGKLKCIQTWNEASDFTIGDFSNNGTKQILLYFEALFDITAEDFMLVQILPSYSILIPSKTVNVWEYAKSATVKLKEKVEVGHSLVLETQRHILLKTAHTLELMKIILKNGLKNNIGVKARQDCWLNNILIHKEIEMNLNNKDVARKAKALEVVDSWKMFKSNTLIFGWTLKNISESCIHQVDGHLASELMLSDYNVTVFIHDEESLGLTMMKQGLVIPGETVSIVVSCQLPKLSKNEYIFSSVVSWNFGVVKGNIGGGDRLEKEKIPDDHMSLFTSLHSDEVLRAKYKDFTDLQELLSFRATQEVMHLWIKTQNSQFSFTDVISQHEPPCKMKIRKHRNWNWALFYDYISVLNGVSLTWSHHSSDISELYLYFRTDSEILLLIRWLYEILPHDGMIYPVECSIVRKQELGNQLLSAVKEELDLLRMFLSHQNKLTREEKETLCAFKDAYFSSRKYNVMKNTVVKREIFTDDLVCKLHNVDEV